MNKIKADISLKIEHGIIHKVSLKKDYLYHWIEKIAIGDINSPYFNFDEDWKDEHYWVIPKSTLCFIKDDLFMEREYNQIDQFIKEPEISIKPNYGLKVRVFIPLIDNRIELPSYYFENTDKLF